MQPLQASHQRVTNPISTNSIFACGFFLSCFTKRSDGTTDVTRTLHFGTPTQEEKECFTRVLKGHIAIDMAVFPKGTTGFSLDILARLPLWQVGLDYRHGTGHGVGAFLNVHEGMYFDQDSGLFLFVPVD
jgi:Xaa-Pro aminopeptidase